MTSAPSVTDIGFSGMRSANSTSADQPVASAIGTSGTSARATPRNATSRTSATASRPASSVSSRRSARGDVGVGVGGEHGQARRAAARTPGGRPSSRRARIASMTALLVVERHEPDAERERRRAAVGADDRAREVRRHGVEQRVDRGRVAARGGRREEVGQRERRAQLGLPAAARRR